MPTTKCHILIAEDNRVNQQVAHDMVLLLGYTCKIVENGAEAIHALKAEDFHLILMDGQMPVLDGYTATQMIRSGHAGEKNRFIPILATMAKSSQVEIGKCFEVGMNDSVPKPISFETLELKMQQWLSTERTQIDDLALQRIRVLEKQSKLPVLRQLVNIFAEDSKILIQKIHDAATAGDLATVTASAHTLKSSAANLGALRLKELAEKIEAATSLSQEISEFIHLLAPELHSALITLREKI